MAKFEKGHTLSKGRPVGALNRSTEQMKLTLARAANKTLDTISEDLEKIRKDNPEKAIQLALQLMEYVMPKLSRTEMKAEINQRLTTASGEINTVITNKQSDRVKVVVKIERPLLDLYEKIRTASGGVAAAALVGNKCNGCNLAINAVEMERIKSLAKDELLRCEECRRILVRI